MAINSWGGILNLLLYYHEHRVLARLLDESVDFFQIGTQNYLPEQLYFGDWIPLRNEVDKIIGFTIAPFVNDTYLNHFVLAARLVINARNVTVESGEYTYLRIWLANCSSYNDDSMNRIDVALLISASKDIAFLLSNVTKEDVDCFGFPLE